MFATETFAQRIRQAREYSDITQVQMAKSLNLARQTYLDIESGKTEPKVSTLMIIAELTSRSVNWLVYGETNSHDIAFSHKAEINELLSLFDELPLMARELVLQQSHFLANCALQMQEVNSLSATSNVEENAFEVLLPTA